MELILREKNGEKFLFALNYQPKKMTVKLHQQMVSLFTGERLQGEIELAPYGVDVYRME